MMKPPSNSPWDLSTLYDTIGSSNNDFGGFLGSSQTLQQTLDAFNGFSSQTQPPPPQQQPPPVGGPPNADYMSNLTSPAMGMTPNVTPSKSDYGDYLPNMMSAGNNPGSSGKKMGYLDQQPLGLAGRGDPASVRRNIVSQFFHQNFRCLFSGVFFRFLICIFILYFRTNPGTRNGVMTKEKTSTQLPKNLYKP